MIRNVETQSCVLLIFSVFFFEQLLFARHSIDFYFTLVLGFKITKCPNSKSTILILKVDQNGNKNRNLLIGFLRTIFAKFRQG